jgi:hypothetical protein
MFSVKSRSTVVKAPLVSRGSGVYRQKQRSKALCRKPMPVVDDALVDADDPLPDAAVASESIADSALPIAAIPVES